MTGVINVKLYIQNMNRTSKLSLGLYAGISIATYVSYNYWDGKQALEKFRVDNPALIGNVDKEIIATMEGINGFENFCSAIIFPYGMWNKVMPSIILYMNPPNSPIK